MTLRMRSAFRKFSRSLPALLLAGLLGSCSEDPTAQNAIVAPTSLPGVTFRDTTIFATQDSTFLTRLPMNGTQDLVGIGGGYTAMAIVRFYSPAGYIDTADVISATLQLFVTYHQGPATGTVSFDVHKIVRQWDPATIDWDSVQSGFYESTSALQPFTTTVPADSQTVTLPLDTALARKWIQTPDSADLDRFGMVLLPTSSSNAIMGFHSFTSDSTAYLPTLTVLTRGRNTTYVDTTVLVSGTSTFAGDCQAPTDQSSLTLQAGVAYRGWLGFDVSFMHQGTIINAAQLMVDRMPNPAFNTTLIDTTIDAHLVTGTTSTTYEATAAVLSNVSATSTTLTGDARHIVQSWLHGTNYGVLLRTTYLSEFSSFDRVQLQGRRSATPALRPRLHIVYSIMSVEKKP